MRAAHRAGLIALGVAAVGCSVRIDFGGTSFSCPDGKTCPAGQTCLDLECVPAAPGDGPGTDGGGADGTTVLRCGGVGLLADDFQDGAVDEERWESHAQGGTTIGETNGQVAITLVSAPGSRFAGYDSKELFDLRDARFSVEAVAVPSAATQAQMYLSASFIDGDALGVRKQGSELVLTRSLDGAEEILHRGAYDPNGQRFWAIREAGGTVLFETSADGAAWHTEHETPTPFDVSFVRLQFGAGTDQGETAPGTAVFGAFNGGAAVGARCPTSSLADDFEDGAMDRAWAWSWADPGCTQEESGGSAIFRPSTVATGSCGYASGAGYTLDQITVEVPEIAVNGAATLLGLVAANGDEIAFLTAGTNLTAGSTTQNFSMSSTIPYSPSEHRFWRLRSDGDRLSWETSGDGTSFATRMTTGVNLDVSRVHLVFGVSTDVVNATPGQARFDGVNPP